MAVERSGCVKLLPERGGQRTESVPFPKYRVRPAQVDSDRVASTREGTLTFLGRSSVRRGLLATILVGCAPSLGAAGGPEARETRPTTEEVVAHAESFLATTTRRQTSTDHFVVVSDSGYEAAASDLAGNLETVYRLLDGLLAGAAVPQPASATKTRVYLFVFKPQFDAFLEPFGASRSAVGVYLPGHDLLAFHTEMYTQPNVLRVMFHECVHAYVHHRLARPGVRVPLWFNEGLAEYVSLSRFRAGRLRIGTYCTTTRHDSPVEDSRELPSGAEASLVAARRAAKKQDDALALEALLPWGADDARRGRDESLRYALSWLLVTYLRDGKPGWNHGAFVRFVSAIGAGTPAPQAMEASYGVPLGEIETGFRTFVAEFRTSPCD